MEKGCQPTDILFIFILQARMVQLNHSVYIVCMCIWDVGVSTYLGEEDDIRRSHTLCTMY